MKVKVKGNSEWNLQLHPGEEVPGLSPALLLLQDHAHISEAELPDEGSHDGSHVVVAVGPSGQGSHELDSSHHVATVEVAVAVVLEVAHHLLRGALDPLGGLSLGALVPAQGTQIPGLGLDDTPGVVVGEWVLGAPGLGLRSAGVAVAERPGVRGDT